MKGKRWTQEDLRQYQKKRGNAKEIEYINGDIEIKIGIPLPSLNKIYGGMHWRERSKMVNVYHAVFEHTLVKFQFYRLQKFRVELNYYSMLDVDNTVYAVKLLVDTLRAMKIVVDDDPRYFRGLTITPDEKLPENTYIFKIISINENNQNSQELTPIQEQSVSTDVGTVAAVHEAKQSKVHKRVRTKKPAPLPKRIPAGRRNKNN